MKILLTGAAGFIGSRLAEVMADEGYRVLGVDNLNAYYDPALKLARLERGGFDRADLDRYGIPQGFSSQQQSENDYSSRENRPAECSIHPQEADTASEIITSRTNPNLQFIRMDIRDAALEPIATQFAPDIIVHLAAQPGVRYSIAHPEDCIHNNVLGFMNVIDTARKAGVQRVLYASSSSVYGDQTPHAFRESDKADSPNSVYGVSKRTNEMLAKVYSDMYGLRLTALRFFSVYGEWGRPDMAPYLFTDALLHDRPITLFNGGQLSRDFTYIDDVVECVRRIILRGGGVYTKTPNHDVVNIGHGSPTLMLDFVEEIEKIIGKKANTILLPMQHGDVHATLADTSKLHIQYGYYPHTRLEIGLRKFIDWFVDYHKLSFDSSADAESEKPFYSCPA